jgi:hypothetical protein
MMGIRLAAVRALLLLCVPLAMTLTGCSYVENHRYDDSKVDLMAQGGGSVAVITQDLRPEVVNGDFGPDYTGVVHAFFGNASIVTTASDRALAQDMTRTVAQALRDRGYDPIELLSAPNQDPREVRDKLETSGAGKTIKIVIKEWRSATWTRTAVRYDIDMEVEDKENGMRASVGSQGRQSLSGSLFHPFIFAQQAVPRFYKETLEELLNREESRSVLGK